MSNTSNLFNLLSVDRDGPVRVAAAGDLTGPRAGGWTRNPLADLLGPKWATTPLLLDLGRTNYVDSSAIGWLLATQKQLRENGGALVVYAVTPRVRQVFDLLRVGKAVALAADEPAARLALKTLTPPTAEAA